MTDNIDHDAIVEELQSQLDYLKAEFIGVNPDWEPLHNLLPAEWCDGWMFMECIGDIRCYKHGITREYLNIDSLGKCYVYKGKRRGYVEVNANDAIDWAYRRIEQCGETRESKYDDAYRARKYAAFAALGLTVIK
jgi:hypothetical protein